MSQAIRAPLTLFLTGAFVLSPLFSSGFAGFSKDQFPVVLDHWPAQPAGWAFSIWGVIYGWLLASAVFGLWKRPKSPEWQGMRIALCVSLAVGTFWIAVANTAPVLATGMILVMAVTAILAACRTGRADPWMLAGPVGLYAGWLTAATGVAFAVTTAGYGLLSGPTAATLAILAVLGVGLAIQNRIPHVVTYPLAIVWALVGIIAANIDPQHWPIAVLAGFGIIAFALQAWRLRPR